MKKIKRNTPASIKDVPPAKKSRSLFNNICSLVDEIKGKIAISVNQQLTLLYWQIGYLIHHEILLQKRAGYGEQIVATLSRQLTARYGSGFTQSGLFRMLNFAAAFPSRKIVATLSQQLSWSHFIEITSLSNKLQREFYLEMCKLERWSVRQLRERIDSMLFERTAISKKPDKLISHR